MLQSASPYFVVCGFVAQNLCMKFCLTKTQTLNGLNGLNGKIAGAPISTPGKI
jgi:hypothetical protein